MSGIVMAPSLLAADQADLRSAVTALGEAADALHIDVMDGHFVPNISMGPAVVTAVRRLTPLPLDVHLMVADPDGWVQPYRDAGADWISVHAEATAHLERTLGHIRELGARAGVVLNPATPFEGLQYVVHDGDFILVMSVNPGYGGQRFLAGTPGKIVALRAFLERHDLRGVDVEVDGGIDADTIGACAAAGARIFVAGSAITGTADPAAATRRLRNLAVAAVDG